MITAQDLRWLLRKQKVTDLMLGRLRLATVVYCDVECKYEINYNTGINVEGFQFSTEELAMQSAVTECMLYLNYSE